MHSYSQYIHVPTTVPVQRFFANPHVVVNGFRWGGAPDMSGVSVDTSKGIPGLDTNTGKWMSFGDKADVFAGKALGKLGINVGSNPITGLSSGVLGAVGDGVYNILGGKNKTGVSNALNAASKYVSMIPGFGKVAGLAMNGIGAFINRGWGSHRNATGINAFNSDTDALNSTRVSDSSYDSIANQASAQDWGGAFDYSDMGETGWFNKGKFENEFNRMMRARASGQNYMAANYDNAATNVQKDTMDSLLMNSRAMGGYFDNPFSHPGSGAIAYGLEQQQLENQRQLLGNLQNNQNVAQQQQHNLGNTYGCGGRMHCFGGRLFDYGGGMPNSHGSDFTNGLVYIEEGGTHEENPYQGVPMGYDQQGVPNVVEEDEIVVPKRMLGNGGNVSDYVLSNRIPITDEFAEKYHLPQGISIAKAAKRLTKESRENPNDIILERTTAKLMQEMRDMQEQIKADMQEQQMQRQMAEQQYAQAMGIPQQAMSVPQEQEAIDIGAMEEQAAQEQAPEMQEPMMALGGNLFGGGGYKNVFATTGDGLFRYPPATVINRPAGRQLIHPFEETWTSLMAPRIRQWVSENFSANQSQHDRQVALDKLNALQEAYYNAGMLGDDLSKIRKSPEIKALQQAAINMGINDVFTDDAMKQWFTNYRNQTGDVDPTYLDSENGGWTKNRVAGIRGMADPQTVKMLRDAGVLFSPDGEFGGIYTAENFPEWTPMQPGVPQQPDAPASTQPSDVETALQEAKDAIAARTGTGDAEVDRGPELLPTWQRNLPLWMSGIGVLTDTLGLTNRPDYAAADRLEALADKSRAYMPVSFHPAGERMRLNLFDPYQSMIANNANAAAAYSAVQDNSNGNGAMANAALLPINRNSVNANGQLSLQGQQYNQGNYERMLDFNRATDLQNAQGIMSADAQNAHNWRMGQAAHQSLIGQALGLRMQEKQAADQARAFNLSNFVRGMSNLGKENLYYNMVMRNPANLGYYAEKSGDTKYWTPKQASTPEVPSVATQPFFGNQPFSLTASVTNPYAKVQARQQLINPQDYAFMQPYMPFFNYNQKR